MSALTRCWAGYTLQTTKTSVSCQLLQPHLPHVPPHMQRDARRQQQRRLSPLRWQCPLCGRYDAPLLCTQRRLNRCAAQASSPVSRMVRAFVAIIWDSSMMHGHVPISGVAFEAAGVPYGIVFCYAEDEAVNGSMWFEDAENMC